MLLYSDGGGSAAFAAAVVHVAFLPIQFVLLLLKSDSESMLGDATALRRADVKSTHNTPTSLGEAEYHYWSIKRHDMFSRS